MKTHLSKTGMKLFQLIRATIHEANTKKREVEKAALIQTAHAMYKQLVTPMMRLEAMGKARNFMSQAAAKRIMAAMIEAERYVDGERAQLGMAL